MADGDDLDCQLIPVGEQALGSLHVGEQDLETTVLDAVEQFFPGPPGVHSHRDRAGRGDPHERGDPLRVVAQGDADPVAGLNAPSLQRIGALGRTVPHVLVGVALVLVDVEVVPGVVQTTCVEVAQVSRRVREHGEVHPADGLGARFVRFARRRHRSDSGFEFQLHSSPPGPRTYDAGRPTSAARPST